MKQLYILLFLSAFLKYPAFAQGPQSLRADITVKPFFKINNTDIQTRIVYDASDKSFYTIAWNGELYHLVPGASGSYSVNRIASAEDHAINYLQGLALHDGTLYLVGNVVIRQGVSGYGKAVKAKTSSGKLVWTEIFRTAEHASSKTLFDHAFSAICFSPDGKDMFVASGSRTDHGEVKDNEGLYPNLREVALTAAIYKFPAETEKLILPDDSAAIQPYIHVRGVRNAFDLAFAGNGDLFSVENSGDRDDPEEMNWIRHGAHYGFPWEMGGNDTPMQFPGYQAEQDKLINHNYTAYQIGAFFDDKNYPQKPKNLTYRKPIPNAGPDADKYRDPATGMIMDASDAGKTIGTFTGHRSPLGLVFDINSQLGGEYRGKGFVLNHQEGSATYGPMQDPGQDLLMLDLRKNAAGDDYSLNAYRIADQFKAPTDAVLVDNKMYVLESQGQIWELSFPKEIITAVNPAETGTSIYPNPANSHIKVRVTADGPVQISLFDAGGKFIRIEQAQAMERLVHVDVSSISAGLYVLKARNGTTIQTFKFLINR